MGDKKSDTRAEALWLIKERLPQRVEAMGPEVDWALGLKGLPRGHRPPIWIRRLICELLEIPHARAKPVKKITQADVAKILGTASGLLTGGRVLFEHPLDTSGLAGDVKSAAVEFQKRMCDVSRPQFARADVALAKIPTNLYRGTPETETAFHSAQSEVVKAIFAPDEDGPVSTEVCFLLWAFWPEVKTATSVRALHDWMTGLGVVHCGAKNFEKICRKIGYRGSTRGRKKSV